MEQLLLWMIVEVKSMKLDIVIDEDAITELTPNYEGSYDEVIDASGKIVMPGLINAHTHLGMSIFRATNDNLSLNDAMKKVAKERGIPKSIVYKEYHQNK